MAEGHVHPAKGVARTGEHRRQLEWIAQVDLGSLCDLQPLGDQLASIIIYGTHSLPLARAMFWIFIPTIYFYIGPIFGLLNNLAQPRMRAMFCAATLFLANVGNLIVAPKLVGMLSDWFAPDHIANAASLRLALLCLAPVGFWSAFHYFYCARYLAGDQVRATGIPIHTV